jgi:hypothetical protein
MNGNQISSILPACSSSNSLSFIACDKNCDDEVAFLCGWLAYLLLL